MQHAEKLTHTLQRLLALIEDEAAANPAFAARLEAITASMPEQSAQHQRKRPPKAKSGTIPDVFTAVSEKGEEEFRFWLRSFDLLTLKGIVKLNGFDPGKASVRWTEPDKFVALIVDQVAARLRRGSAFLPPRAGPNSA